MPPSALLIIAALIAADPSPGPTQLPLVGDLDDDGQVDRLTFHRAGDGTRGFLELLPARGGASTTSPLYPAWKAAVGRLDGERDAVVLGTWTTKRTRPGEPARRSIWVVALERGRWVERWRGSALARPFVDYALRDLDGDGRDELIVRECEGPTQGYAAYAWQGFGFAGRARTGAPCDGRAPAWDRMRIEGGRLWLDD